MTVAVRALLLGWFAGGVVAVVAAAGVALVGSAAREPLRIALGPLSLLEVEVRSGATGVLLGPGLLVVALVFGILNAVAALALGRRRGRRDPIA